MYSIVMSNADTRTTPPIAKAVNELRSKSRPLALRALRARRIMIWPSSVAQNPQQKARIAKGKTTMRKMTNDVVAANEVKRIMAEEVAATTPGWTPMASMMGTVITASSGTTRMYVSSARHVHVRNGSIENSTLHNNTTTKHSFIHTTYHPHQSPTSRQTTRPSQRPSDREWHSEHPI